MKYVSENKKGGREIPLPPLWKLLQINVRYATCSSSVSPRSVLKSGRETRA